MNLHPPLDHERPTDNYYLRRRLIDAHRKVALFASLATANGLIAIVLTIFMWWKLS